VPNEHSFQPPLTRSSSARSSSRISRQFIAASVGFENKRVHLIGAHTCLSDADHGISTRNRPVREFDLAGVLLGINQAIAIHRLAEVAAVAGLPQRKL
jgi:hypothetical protein